MDVRFIAFNKNLNSNNMAVMGITKFYVSSQWQVLAQGPIRTGPCRGTTGWEVADANTTDAAMDGML